MLYDAKRVEIFRCAMRLFGNAGKQPDSAKC